MADLDLNELERLAREATPQDFDSAKIKPEGGWIECPHCGGNGEVELEADYCNYDGQALGVQFYGIGNAHGAAENYYRAARPAVVLAMIARIREMEAAARFTGMVFKAHRNDGYPGDIDGDALQRMALECGLLEEREVTESCGANCSCADVGEFPAICYFNTHAARIALDAAADALAQQPAVKDSLTAQDHPQEAING